ncbi:MAG: response regulator [Chloroflexota bacterium]
MINDHIYLYVEDDPLSREALEVILRRVMKIERLHVFEDSADFMDRLSGLPDTPDFILLDIHMQPYTGFEMLNMLRGEPTFQDAIIIALTASVMNEEVQLLRESGFDGVIGKPINVATFPGLIQRVIQGESIWYITEN